MALPDEKYEYYEPFLYTPTFRFLCFLAVYGVFGALTAFPRESLPAFPTFGILPKGSVKIGIGMTRPCYEGHESVKGVK